MRRYVLRKLLALPAVMLAVSLLVFAAIRILPGDPARLLAGPEATQDAVDAMRGRLGLDRSLPVQYAHFLAGVATGDLGVSLKSKLPVTQEIAERFPNTAALAGCAYGLAILVGVPAGVAAAARRGGWLDQGVMLGAIAGASIANFWLALMAMDLFAVRLGWLPLLGLDSWRSFVMPTVTLALAPTALVARMTRSSMGEVLKEDYIRTAHAKGLGMGAIYRRHALRNAMAPVVTAVGLNFGGILGGAVVTETLFNWPGLGRLLIDSVSYRDYPMIQALVLLAVLCVVAVNLAADLAIAALNPRIRFD